MASLRRWEIYWVDVPASQTQGREYRNGEPDNARPWLVVSDPRTQRGGVVLAVPLTTKLARANDRGSEDFRVEIRPDEVTTTPSDRGDITTSVAACDHLRSLSIKRFRSRLGKLKNTSAPLIEQAIRNALGMDDDL
jgi:mRNA-degrading endonuclease toxin of MazEF toxin-antitoxin module